MKSEGLSFWLKRYSEIVKLGESHREAAARLQVEARRAGQDWSVDQVKATLDDMSLSEVVFDARGDENKLRFCESWRFEKPSKIDG